MTHSWAQCCNVSSLKWIIGIWRLIAPFCMHCGAMYALWQSGDAVSQQSSTCRMLSLEMHMSRKTRAQIGSAAPAACAARPAHPYLATDTGRLSSYLLCVQVPSSSDRRRDGRSGAAGAQKGPSELDGCAGRRAGAREAAGARLFRLLGGQQQLRRGDQQWRRRSQRGLVAQPE